MAGFGLEGGLALALARGAAVAALLSAFGTLVFQALVLPKVLARAPDAAGSTGPLDRLARGSLIAAAALLPAWGLLQTADLANACGNVSRTLAAVPDVLEGTQFGHLLLVQLLAALLGAWAVPRRTKLALGAAAAALLLQAGHGHAWSMGDGPGLLLLAGLLHLLAAGAWLGGLWPLLVVVRASPPRAGALAARWFSPLGKACVVGIVLSSAMQFWALVGGLPGLVGTSYGWVALAKLGLFGILFAFAAANRYRLAPALLRDTPDAARRRLVAAIAVQTGFGVAAVLAAGVLSNLPPSVHEQPAWPFPLRPSLAVMTDPDLADEVRTGALMLAGAGVLPMALAWRPMRRSALATATATAAVLGAVALAWRAAPHLQLLLVEAYPTSYYASPAGFAAASIAQGAALYPDHCARCHGAEGRGDGPDAAALAMPPANLTAAHLWEHSDGEMFWWLLHGIEAPDGTLAMAGTAGVLSDDQRWALIDVIRARNAGLALREAGHWPQPVQLPGFSLSCPGQLSFTTDDLRGRVLYVVAEAADRPLPTMPDGVVPIVLTQDNADNHPGICSAADPAAWGALAVVTGQPPDTLAGTRLLVDGSSWMRSVKSETGAAAWDRPGALAAAAGAILAAPVTVSTESAHHHH